MGSEMCIRDSLNSIKGSLSEKQTQHMLDPQQIPKQLMSNLLPHSKNPIEQETIDNFFRDIIETKFKGTDEYNLKLKEALDSDEIQRSTEDDILRNLDKVGLNNVVDAIKNNNHPKFVAELYKKILRSNVESLTADYQSGEITSREFLDNIAEAKTFTSSINRMMEIYPDLAVFLHKDVRNYMQAAMRNFVVNKIIRPKWDYSISTRMRGLDPWLRADKRFSDMNIDLRKGTKGIRATKKYLKDTYGVENPDQLFYLDDLYRDVKYDMSPFIDGLKGKDKMMTLGYVWDNYGGPKATPKIKDFFKTVSVRVPMDSISGAHEVAFAGFTGIKGHGAVFHPRTMRALGGADLDGDKAFVLFGMKPEYREMYHKNKYEFRNEETRVIEDNKAAPINAAGKKILLDILKDKDSHDKQVIAKIKSGKEVTWQDLFTFTNDTSTDNKSDAYKSFVGKFTPEGRFCLLYTSPSPRDLSTSRMPSSA